MGLFDGEASVAFTYWIMYKLTAEESYIVYAKKQCQFVLDNDYQVTSDDLIQGRAGIIILLLLMYKTTQDKMYLDIAQKVGTNLVESIQSKNWQWLYWEDIQEKKSIKKLCWSYAERKISYLIIQ